MKESICFYIQKVGITKALKHVDKIRIELIYYAVLKCKVSIDETKIIKSLIHNSNFNQFSGSLQQ